MFLETNLVRHPLAMMLAASWCFAAVVLAADAPVLPSSSLAAASDAGTNPASLFPLAATDKAAPAAGTATAAEPTRVAPSQNVTINLINRLVQRNVLTKEDAAELIKQAEKDAADARAQAAVSEQAQTELRDAALQISNQASAMQSAATQPPPLPPPSDDTVRVTYIPEVVKAQMRDQIKEEVMQQARDENWAAPRTLPEWVPRFRVSGDIRVRYEGDFYPSGNDNTGAFPNFNAINTGTPFDVTGTQFSPQYNVDQTRERFRLRLRLGAEIDLGENFTAGVRIGTGQDNSPVTGNQTIGLANQGQGGNFSKYAVWLDRAFLKYEVGGKPEYNFAITVGRFDNPFFSTSMIWSNDLGFDGALLQGKYEVLKGVTPFLTAGAFPVFNTDLNFSSNQPKKFKSADKYLYAVQAGTEWKISKDFSTKVAGAYYYFQNIEGKLSSPYTPLTAQDAGNTDDSRPSFAQKGNTYMALRNIVPNASNNFGAINQWQYFGLATPFHDFAFTGRLDYSHFDPVRVSLVGEYVKNLAFDKNAINTKAVNNRGADSATSSKGAFVGGDTGWIVNLKIGTPALEKLWDWSLAVGYRYVESDAVVDGLNDSDFGGGGTNLKGYTIGGSLALSQRVWLDLRWLSADSIDGPPYQNDIIQFDINGRF